MKKELLLSIISLVALSLSAQDKPIINAFPLNENETQISFEIPLNPGEYIYADNISLTADHPDIHLSAWQSSPAPVMQFDGQQQTMRKSIIKSPTISTIATRKKDTDIKGNVHVRLVYYTNKTKRAHELLYPLIKSQNYGANEKNIQETHSGLKPIQQENPAQKSTPKETVSWSDYITNLAQNTNNIWIQLLFIFLLGLLLSLTPCIYPMIPITMGILQAQGSKSVWNNVLLSLAYTVGIATTFALLGLTAAFAGYIVGDFLNSPYVRLFIVVLLVYVAFSLFGLYELYIPRPMQKQGMQSGGKGFLSAFLFGAVSGSVASPCLSPGLIFVLTLVATSKSALLGFILLFVFGIGLSIPLLIIGAFSSSISLMPRAGMWMNEIKYLFGFMILAMCFYFLKGIIPTPIILILLGILALCAGIFYVYHARTYPSALGKKMLNIIGFILVACSPFIASQGIKSWFMQKQIPSFNWETNYTTALEKAKNQNKKLFVLIHAPLCIACSELEHALITNNRFVENSKNIIAAHIDIAEQTNATKHIQQHFNILGAPTSILIDPTNETVIERWDGELTQQQINKLITALAQQ